MSSHEFFCAVRRLQGVCDIASLNALLLILWLVVQCRVRSKVVAMESLLRIERRPHLSATEEAPTQVHCSLHVPGQPHDTLHGLASHALQGTCTPLAPDVPMCCERHELAHRTAHVPMAPCPYTISTALYVIAAVLLVIRMSPEVCCRIVHFFSIRIPTK